MTDIDDLDDITPSFPVVVEYTLKHVVWVEAPDRAAAAQYVQGEPYEYTNDQTTLTTFWSKVEEPSIWDWDDIYTKYSDSGYTTQADAHVQTHEAEMRRQKLAADRAACTAAGHPDTKPPIWDGRIWCNGCITYLEPAANAEQVTQ